MNEMYSSSDIKSEILENGFTVKSELLEGGVKLVTVESINEFAELPDTDIPNFLAEPVQDGVADHMTLEEYNALADRVEKLIATPSKMNSIDGLKELRALVGELCDDNRAYIRGLCETMGDVSEAQGDGLIYINKEKMGIPEEAKAVTQSIIRQIEAYKTVQNN